MSIKLSEEQEMIRRMIAEFAKKEIAPIAKEIDETRRFPRENFEKMGELGLLGVLIPKEYGGAEGSYATCTLVMEEIARCCASTALSYAAHAILCAHNIHRLGSEEQRKKYLPDLCSGKKIGAMGLTEPMAGSDALALLTFAKRKGDKYILNGSKIFITNAPVADTFLVWAKTARGSPRESLSAFIVEKEFPGFHVGKKLEKMGMRGSPTSEIYFEECEVPAENLLGKEGGGLGALLDGLDIERVTLAGLSVGIGHAALDASVRYAQERHQFQQPLASFQMIQKMIADMATEVEAARLLVYHYADVLDEGRPIRKAAAMAKLFASEVGTRAALAAIQIHGGYGYTREYNVERFMRDAKLMEIGAGTSEIQRHIIAREIFKGVRLH